MINTWEIHRQRQECLNVWLMYGWYQCSKIMTSYNIVIVMCSFFVTDTFSSLTGGFLKKVLIFRHRQRQGAMTECSFFVTDTFSSLTGGFPTDLLDTA